MGALRQKQAGTDMPQIVESHWAETGFFKQAAELTADGGAVQRRADGRSKDEARFLPPVARYSFLPFLTSAVSQKGVLSELGYGHGLPERSCSPDKPPQRFRIVGPELR